MLHRVEVRARGSIWLSPSVSGEKGYQIHTLPMLLEQVGMMAQKIGKCFLEPPTASPRRSDRANASGTGAEAFSAMKLRPFPARIWETVRNIDRAPPGHHITKRARCASPMAMFVVEPIVFALDASNGSGILAR